MAGPVWVTSPSALESFGVVGHSVEDSKAKWNGITEQDHLSLGWLMVEKDEKNGNTWQMLEEQNELLSKLPELVRNRVVMVSDKLFSQVVNSNLEVRTSVAINPETGAAEGGALFTYEAIPRAAFLWMDVVVDDYRVAFPNPKQLKKWDEILNGQSDQIKMDTLKKWNLFKESDNISQFSTAVNKANTLIEESLNRWNSETMKDVNPQSLIGLINSGLEWAEHLGIGGMGTRGFGRIRKIDCIKMHPTEDQEV